MEVLNISLSFGGGCCPLAGPFAAFFMNKFEFD